jgi:HSP20 family protein
MLCEYPEAILKNRFGFSGTPINLIQFNYSRVITTNTLPNLVQAAEKEVAEKEQDVKATTPAPARREIMHPFADLRAEMDRLFDRFSSGFPSLSMGRDLFDWDPFRISGGTFSVTAPHVDVSETDKGYEISAELPGMDEKDINVEVKDDVLTVSGEKKEESEKEAKDYHVSERRFGSFRRSFRLPSGVNQDKLSADFKKGVLKIALPKSAESQKKSRKIDVKAK